MISYHIYTDQKQEFVARKNILKAWLNTASHWRGYRAKKKPTTEEDVRLCLHMSDQHLTLYSSKKFAQICTSLFVLNTENRDLKLLNVLFHISLPWYF